MPGQGPQEMTSLARELGRPVLFRHLLLTSMRAATVSGERETLRLAAPVIFWWAWLAFAAANVIDYAVQGLPSARFGAVLAAVLLFVTGLAYTLALRPKVVIGGDGVMVVNPYRTHVVPWRLITAVDTGEWVRIHYTPAAAGGAATGFGRGAAASSAGGKTVQCWA